MTDSSQQLERKITSALAVSMGARIAAMALRMLSVLLLPLWLTPGEIGYTALIMACVNLPIAFADLGFGTALVKFQDLEEKDFHTVYTLNLITALLLAVGLVLLAPSLASLTNAELLPTLLPIAAFAIPLSILAVIPNAKLQRDLRFNSLAMRDLIGEVGFSVSSVVLALLGFGAMSVAIALVLHRLLRYLTASIAVDWKPRLAWHASSFKRLVGFSFWQFQAMLLNQLFYNLDKILISSFLSPVPLGYYNVAVQVAVNPVSSLTGAARNVFFASFAKIQDDIVACRALLLKLIRYMVLLSLAVSALGLPWLALLPKVYGSEWVHSVLVAQLLFAGAVVFSADLIESMIVAIGGEMRRVFSNVLRLVIMVGGIIALQSVLSPVVVALLLLASGISSALLNFDFARKRLHIAWRDLRQSLRMYPVVVALGAAVMASFVTPLDSLWQCVLYSVIVLAFLLFAFRGDWRKLRPRPSARA